MTTAPDPVAGEAAEKLKGLAGEPRLSARKDQFTALAEAIEGGVDRERWADIDLYAAFGQENAIDPAGGWLRAGGHLGGLIQILVFTPIGVTWFGLMAATSAYRQTLTVPRLAGESFLQGWQTGFGGRLTDALTLSHIALYTVILIALIVILTAAHFLAAGAEERDRGALLRRLGEAITAADLVLAPIRSGSLSTTTAEFSKVSAEISKVSAEVRKVSAEVSKTAADVGKTAVDIGKVGKTADQAQGKALASLDTAREALARVELGTEALAKAADTVGERLGDVGAATKAVAAAETELARSVKDSGDRLNNSVDGIGGRVQDAIGASQRAMSAAVSDSSARIADALDGGASQVRDGLTGIQATGAVYVHRVEVAADILGQAGQTIQDLPAAVQLLHRRVADLGDRITELDNGISAATAAAAAGTTAVGLDAAVNDLKDSANALQAAARLLLAVPAAPAASGRRGIFRGRFS
jgi:hypothetical protein